MGQVKMSWSRILDELPTSSYRLRAALFTTYAPPEGAFLAEVLIPKLLGIERNPGETGEERAGFFAELLDVLDANRNFITVISSEDCDEPQAASLTSYPWLLRGPSVHGYRVGAEKNHVQHAKLWMLHWVSKTKPERERLTVVISSANLTSDAFHSQIQAAWVHEEPLRSRQIDSSSWRPLIGFLSAIAKSSNTEEAVRCFESLLARMPPLPTDTLIIPCVPWSGNDIRFGMPRLKDVLPPKRYNHTNRNVRILTPYLGTWAKRELIDWCKACSINPDAIEIAWPDADHAWAVDGRFAAVPEAIKSLRPHLRCLPTPAPALHAQHDPERDTRRWPHAKLYGFSMAKKKALLLTSANFSPSAWCLGNFELGVLLQGCSFPKINLRKFWNGKKPAQSKNNRTLKNGVFRWISAVWDGHKVSCTFRVKAKSAIAEVRAARCKTWLNVAVHKTSGPFHGTLKWTDSVHPPIVFRVYVGREWREVAVLDEREQEHIDCTAIEDLDPDILQLERYRLILERYGGPLVDPPPPGPPTNIGDKTGFSVSDVEGYSVDAIVYAREWFSAIDRWALTLKRANTDIACKAALRDGQTLLQALCYMKKPLGNHMAQGQLHVAARAVYDELKLRLTKDSHA